MSNIVPYHNNYYQPHLGGFFGWLKKAIRATVKAVVSVATSPSTVFGIIDDFFDGDGTWMDINFKFSDFPLTTNDEKKLDNWRDGRFIPLFKIYFGKLKEFVQNPPTQEEFAAYYKEVHLFIGVLKYYHNYVDSVGEPGLTINAIRARKEYIKKQIEILEKDIQSYIQSTGKFIAKRTSSVSVSKSEFKDLGFNLPDVFTVTIKELNLTHGSGNDSYLISNQDPNPQIPEEVKPYIKPDKSNKTTKTLVVLGGIAALVLIAKEKKRNRK